MTIDYNTTMFEQKFHVSTVLLDNIVKIKNIVKDLNNKKFPDLILAQLKKMVKLFHLTPQQVLKVIQFH